MSTVVPCGLLAQKCNIGPSSPHGGHTVGQRRSRRQFLGAKCPGSSAISCLESVAQLTSAKAGIVPSQGARELSSAERGPSGSLS